MADFRKVFLVLGVALLCALSASAQVIPPFSCTAVAGVPPTLRAEGLTELSGDVVLTCKDGNPAQPITVNIQVYANTTITSKVLSTGGSEALLLINDPPGGSVVIGTNAYRGVPASGASSVMTWTGIPLTPPGTNNVLILRMTNLRVDASKLLPPGTVSTSLLPQQLIMFVSISGSTTVPVTNSQLVTGYVQNAMSFAITNCANTDTYSRRSYRQCSSRFTDIETAGKTTAFGSSTAGDNSFGIRFVENFPTAFRVKTSQVNSVPGTTPLESENGFTSTNTGSNVLGNEAGMVTNGTRLIARWSNVPRGVRLYVPVGNVWFDAGGTTYGGSKTLKVQLMTGTDAYGAGGAAATPLATVSAISTTYPQCGDTSVTLSPTATSSQSGIQIVEVPVDASGNAMLVWEVTAASGTAIETAWFPVIVRYSANVGTATPAPGTANVYGVLGPAYPSSVSSAFAASLEYPSGLPYPRFIDVPPASLPQPFRIVECITNILFPFVTNQAGFDTGIALVNTGRDPYSSNNASEGTCTINYYGDLAGGAALTKTSETSSTVKAGSYLVFSLSGSSNDSRITGNPGFQGYLVVRCNFSYAHGYAFISDFGAQKLAHGYLALIIDQTNLGRSGITTTAAESLNN